MIQKLSLACLTAGVLLTGCVSAGVKVDQAQLTRFQPGVTTCDEVKAALGTPTTSTLHSTGTRQLVYTYHHSDLDAGAIALAVIGIPAGRSSTEQTNVVLDCDAAGVLQTYSSTQGQYGVGMGVTGGAKQ